jgi:hypothetical protein
MKKSILILLAFAGMATVCKAQNLGTDNRENMHFGIKAGINYANVYDAQGEQFNADGKIGFAGGGFLSIPIGKFLGVQPEVLFSQKGFQATGSLLGFDYKYTHTANYLDIPLMFSVKPTESVSILAGPQYSYLISQKNEFTSTIYSDSQEQEFNNDNIRKNTFCFIGGLDINLSNIVISGRVGWDLFKNNGDGTSTTPRYKNTWYQATVGFRL